MSVSSLTVFKRQLTQVGNGSVGITAFRHVNFKVPETFFHRDRTSRTQSEVRTRENLIRIQSMQTFLELVDLAVFDDADIAFVQRSDDQRTVRRYNELQSREGICDCPDDLPLPSRMEVQVNVIDQYDAGHIDKFPTSGAAGTQVVNEIGE